MRKEPTPFEYERRVALNHWKGTRGSVERLVQQQQNGYHTSECAFGQFGALHRVHKLFCCLHPLDLVIVLLHVARSLTNINWLKVKRSTVVSFMNGT
jgi:hypothetical protein